MQKISAQLRNHRLALIFAFFVGLIYILPQILFIFSLGNNYQGVPFMQIDDENIYVARMHDILDGYYLLGSPVFFDYKDQYPMVPPVSEYFYVLPSLILKIPLVYILIASKFILPTILFLLIYFLIYKLVDFENVNKKLTAVGGSLLVVLGYDLVDYNFLWHFLNGNVDPAGWLIWARPVNPILGAIFLFSFLLFILRVFKINNKKTDIFVAGLFLALMISSYFFSWGMAFSILFILGIIFLIKKDYIKIKKLFYIFFVAIIITIPYWFLVFSASKSVWYKDAQKMSGLLHTHQMVVNKILLLSLVFYILFYVYQKFYKNYIIQKDWFVICVSFIIGGLWAFNQQIITGIVIWPFHFVQYSIPLAIISLILMFYYILRERILLWRVFIILMIILSLSYGIFTHYKVYGIYYKKYASYQNYGSVFSYLNQKTEKDSVVLVNEKQEDLTHLIPAFTHNNIYISTYRFTLIPEAKKRFYHNYLVLLKLKGVTPENINGYLFENREEASTYLADNWYSLLHNNYFNNIDNSYFEEMFISLSDDYKVFYSNDFQAELKKYRLDYILSDGELAQSLVDEFSEIKLIFNKNNFYLYKLN